MRNDDHTRTGASRSAFDSLQRQVPGAVRDVRGGLRLALDGVQRAIDRLESLHQRVAEVEPRVQGVRVGSPNRGVTAVVYRGLRGTTELLGGGLDLGLASLQAWMQPGQAGRMPLPPQPVRDAAVAVLNGIAGDHLHRTHNPLALPLRLNTAPALPAHPRVLVLLHDLCGSEASFRHEGHDHGQALAAALGCSPVYVTYNSGRHVGATGRELATELEALVARWGVPVESLAIIGHGLGGLLARSALHHAALAGMAWPHRLHAVVFLGTPHQGADLPRGALGLLPQHRVPGLSAALMAPLPGLATRRSEGVQDFANGRFIDDGADRRTTADERASGSPMPPGTAVFAVAGSTGGADHDGVVSVASALGRHAVDSRDLHLPADHGWIAQGVDHAGLLGSEAVFQKLRQWLTAPPTA